jgi:hypothetical protein
LAEPTAGLFVAGILPALFVVVFSDWLALPAQIADHHHFFGDGVTDRLAAYLLGVLGVLGG